jgi:UDP-N-acetyl-D-glucosamine dehydrogenase
LSWKAREYDFHTKFIELAAETNLEMPFFTAMRIQRLLNKRGVSLRGARILVLGAAFKKDIDDARNSVAIRVMEILLSQGAEVEYHDPFVPEVRLASSLFGDDHGAVSRKSVPLESKRIMAADCVAVLVGHSAVDYGMVLANAQTVFDAVNATRGEALNGKLERL